MTNRPFWKSGQQAILQEGDDDDDDDDDDIGGDDEVGITAMDSTDVLFSTSAAAAGVGANPPSNSAAHFSALATVRLYTQTSWPPRFFRCPAMGYPITPSPINATVAISNAFCNVLLIV